MSPNRSTKVNLIDKANRSMFLAIALSAAALVFSIVSISSLLKVSQHRSEVISQKRTASNQLKANDTEIGKLILSFQAFENAPMSGLDTTDKNSKIILDALPPGYDFPALVTSLEKILTEGQYNITSISGTDNEVSEIDDASAAPGAVEIPFTLSVSGPYEKIKNVPLDLERSIRPMHITAITLSGSANDAVITITAQTYYQPGKNLDLRYKEVRTQ